jgi:hypothetical protein
MAKQFDPFQETFPPEQLAFLSVFPILYELDHHVWHLAWEVFWEEDDSDFEGRCIGPRMFHPHLERMRAILQDQRIVDLERLRQPACLRLSNAAVHKMNEAMSVQTVPSLQEALRAVRDAVEPTANYLRSLTIGALGPFGAFFLLEAVCESRSPMEIAKHLERQWGWGLACWTPDSARLLVENPEATSPLIYFTPLQRSILKALDGRALKKMQLAAEVCGGEANGNLLYRYKDLKSLESKGLVKHARDIGFYRPDAPPPGAVLNR